MNLQSLPIGNISRSSITSVHDGFTMTLKISVMKKDIPLNLTIYRTANLSQSISAKVEQTFYDDYTRSTYIYFWSFFSEMPAESPSAKSQKTDCANQNTMYFFLSIALLLILFIILLIFGLVLYSVKKSHKMAIDEAREENQYRALTDMDLNRMDTTASVSTYLVDSV